MTTYLMILMALVAVLGAGIALLSKNAFNKLIGVAVIASGTIPFIAIAGYLDVAVAVALLLPLTTIMILKITVGEDV